MLECLGLTLSFWLVRLRYKEAIQLFEQVEPGVDFLIFQMLNRFLPDDEKRNLRSFSVCDQNRSRGLANKTIIDLILKVPIKLE